jgi:hypothetical protein
MVKNDAIDLNEWYKNNKKLYMIESKYQIIYKAIDNNNMQLMKIKILEIYMGAGKRMPVILNELNSLEDSKIIAQIWLSGLINGE